MIIKKAFDAEIHVEKNGVKKQKLYDNPKLKIMHITLDPGACVEKHSAPVDVVFYILEGEGWIIVGDEKEKVSRDSIIESPKNIPHGIDNSSGDKILRVMVVKIL